MVAHLHFENIKYDNFRTKQDIRIKMQIYADLIY